MRRSLYITFIRTFLIFFITFVTSIVVSRLLGPREIGLFVIALGIISFLGVFREFGIGRYVIQCAEIRIDDVKAIYTIAVSIGFFLFLFTLLSKNWISNFYKEPKLAELLNVLAFVFLVAPIGQPTLALLRREERQFPVAIITLFSAVAGSTIAVAFAFGGYGAISMAYGAVVSEVTGAALALCFPTSYGQIGLSFRNWWPILRFGAVASLGSMASQLQVQAPSLILGRMLGAFDVGLFFRSRALSRTVWTQSVQATSWVLGATLGRQYRSGQPMWPLIRLATNNLCTIGWPAMAFLAVEADKIIVLLYGEQWASAASLVPPICISISIMFLASQTGPVYEAVGAVNLHFRTNLIALLITIFFLLLGSTHSINLVAWLQIPSSIMIAILHWLALKKYVDEPLYTIFKDCKVALFCVISVCFVSFLSDKIFQNIEINHIANLITILLISIIASFIMIIITRHPLYYEFLKLRNILIGYFLD